MDLFTSYLESLNEYNVAIGAIVGILTAVLALFTVAVKSYLDLRKGRMVLRVQAEGQFRTDYLQRLEKVEADLADCRASHLECEQRANHLEARLDRIENGHF